MSKKAPVSYSDELATRICDAIAASDYGLAHILREDDELPSERSVYNWLREYPEFRKRYDVARDIQQDRQADKCVEIADLATDANLARIQIDARKWRAAKLRPNKYGDKIDVNAKVGNPDGTSFQSVDNRRLAMAIFSIVGADQVAGEALMKTLQSQAADDVPALTGSA